MDVLASSPAPDGPLRQPTIRFSTSFEQWTMTPKPPFSFDITSIPAAHLPSGNEMSSIKTLSSMSKQILAVSGKRILLEQRLGIAPSSPG